MTEQDTSPREGFTVVNAAADPLIANVANPYLTAVQTEEKDRRDERLKAGQDSKFMALETTVLATGRKVEPGESFSLVEVRDWYTAAALEARGFISILSDAALIQRQEARTAKRIWVRSVILPEGVVEPGTKAEWEQYKILTPDMRWDPALQKEVPMFTPRTDTWCQKQFEELGRLGYHIENPQHVVSAKRAKS